MTPTWESDCGRVTLYCADCLDVLPTLTGVDAVVTDPPYGIADCPGGPQSRTADKGNYRAGGFPDTEDYVKRVCAGVILHCVERFGRVVLTPGRINLWYYPKAKDVGIFFQPAAVGVSFWGRPTWQPILFYGTAPKSGEQLRSLHYQLTESSPDNGHPCPKPIRAWTWLVDKASRPGEVILDPFMGSGTTGVAALRLGCRFIGIEISPEYFEIAKRRIQAELAQGKLTFAEATK